MFQPSWGFPLKEIELKERVLGKPTAYAITPMISLYGRMGYTNKADAMLQMMKDKGITRIPSIYNALMKCHSNDIIRVESLYKGMTDDGLKAYIVT
jgi:pentatricopeptide repeat protein